VDNNLNRANGPDDSFYERVVLYLDGRMDAGADSPGSDWARFQRELASDPAKRQLFAEICFQATLLAESGLPLAPETLAAARAAQTQKMPLRPASGRPGSRAVRPRSPVLGAMHDLSKRVKGTYGELRVNMALALVLTLLFAGGVAGTGALVSAIILRNRSQPEVAERPQRLDRGLIVRDEQGPKAEDDTEEDAPSESGDEDSPPPATRRVVNPVARLARTIDCVWSGGPAGYSRSGSASALEPVAGDDLGAGESLVLKSGLAEIAFQGGARAILQGPATLEVRSRSSAALNRGKCTVTVENALARGFEIRAPGMKYTDLGTEFGVVVAESGVQEAHVFRGKVQAERRKDAAKGRKGEGENTKSPRLPFSPSPPLILTAHQAIRVATPGAAGKSIKPIELIPANTKDFVRALPPATALDLVDIVAGGDGLSTRRNREINPANGRFGDEPGGSDNVVPGEGTVFRADHQYHRVPSNQLIDGVFIVHGGKGPVQLDSAGHRFAGFPHNDGKTANMIQAVGATPARPGAWFTAKQNNLPQLGGVDYSSIGHGVLAIRGNKGITFDLAAVRAAHPGYRVQSFGAVAGNSCRENTPRPGNFWVFIDGQLRFQRRNVPVNSGPIPLEIPLQPADRYLTLVTATSTSNGIWNGTMFGDPKLNLAAIESSPKDTNKD
jgi:hypothetical protein